LEAAAVPPDDAIYEVVFSSPGKPDMGTRVQAGGAVHGLGGRGAPASEWRLLWTMDEAALTGFRREMSKDSVSALPERFEKPDNVSHSDATATYRIEAGDRMRTIVVEGPLHHRIPVLAAIHEALNQTRPHQPTATTWFITDDPHAPPVAIEMSGNPMSVPQMKDLALLVMRRPDADLPEAERPIGAPLVEVHWFEDGTPVDARSVWRDGSIRQGPAQGDVRWGKVSPDRLAAIEAALAELNRAGFIGPSE
jgi:hypothetical protein